MNLIANEVNARELLDYRFYDTIFQLNILQQQYCARSGFIVFNAFL